MNVDTEKLVESLATQFSSNSTGARQVGELAQTLRNYEEKLLKLRQQLESDAEEYRKALRCDNCFSNLSSNYVFCRTCLNKLLDKDSAYKQSFILMSTGYGAKPTLGHEPTTHIIGGTVPTTSALMQAMQEAVGSILSQYAKDKIIARAMIIMATNEEAARKAEFHNQVMEARRVWMEENPCEDGHDHVTPFDKF
jgi:Uncharacterized protein related to glutamine synthetase